MTLGVGIVFRLRDPEDKKLPRDHKMSLEQVLLSNLVLILIMSGGALMALAVI